jgi:hypothetical protein
MRVWPSMMIDSPDLRLRTSMACDSFRVEVSRALRRIRPSLGGAGHLSGPCV